jgi:F-type H+-transporting ATPase subunit b
MKILTSIAMVLGQAAWAMAAEGGQTAAEGGDRGLFSGTFGEAVWTVAAFVALLLVLGRFAWKPLLSQLKAREEHIQHQIDAANTARQQAERLLEQYKVQGLEIVQKAYDEAQRREAEMLERAQQELGLLKREAEGDIEHARQAALESLWQQAGEIVGQVSGEVLGRSVQGDDQQRLVREAVDKVRQHSSGGKAR